MAFGDLVQEDTTTNANSAAFGLTANLPGTATSGNLLVAPFFHGYGDPMPSVSGYTRSLIVDNVQAGEVDSCCVYWKISDGTETSITVTHDYSEEIMLFFAEFEGPFDATPLDVNEPEARQASGTSYAISTTATTVASELAIAILYTRSSSNSNITWTNGFTEATNSENTTDYKSFAWAYKVLTSTGAISTTPSFGTNTVSMGGAMSFKGTGGGSSIIPQAMNYYAQQQ